jgi:hypothetical protein
MPEATANQNKTNESVKGVLQHYLQEEFLICTKTRLDLLNQRQTYNRIEQVGRSWHVCIGRDPNFWNNMVREEKKYMKQ